MLGGAGASAASAGSAAALAGGCAGSDIGAGAAVSRASAATPIGATPPRALAAMLAREDRPTEDVAPGAVRLPRPPALPPLFTVARPRALALRAGRSERASVIARYLRLAPHCVGWYRRPP